MFSVDLNKNEEPLNLGKPVNTEKDDFAFTFNKENIIGYLSSNRSGNDDIYVSTPVRKSQILTVVKDIKTGLILENSKVVILDSLNNILETKMSNEKGEVVYDVESGKSYSIEVSKEGFETKSFVVDDTKSDKITVDAYVSPIEINVADTETTTILNPIYFEFNKSNITKKGAAELDKLVYVMSQNDKLIINVKAHTDNRGSDAYNMYLSDRRAKSTVQYIISKGVNKDRISGKGFGESEPKIDCKANCTGEEHALNRRSEFLIVK